MRSDIDLTAVSKGEINIHLRDTRAQMRPHAPVCCTLMRPHAPVHRPLMLCSLCCSSTSAGRKDEEIAAYLGWPHYGNHKPLGCLTVRQADALIIEGILLLRRSQ